MREAGSGTRAVLEEVLAEQNLLAPRMALGSNEAVPARGARRAGLAVLSRHTLADRPASEGLAVLPVAGFPLKRQWVLVWHGQDGHRPCPRDAAGRPASTAQRSGGQGGG